VNPMEGTVRLGRRTTLPSTGVRALSAQAALLAMSAALLPVLSHLAGLPVRWMLPMHWAVLLAGLTYGWRAGAVIGLLAPGASFLLSGMPLPHVLPAMTLELGAYGMMAGFARQGLRLPGVASTLIAIAVGRVVFVVAALATGAAGPVPATYLQAAVLPGLPAAAAQALLLPPLARWWIRRESRA